MSTATITFKEVDSRYKFIGLKPFTRHYFYYNKVKQTDRVKQLGKKLGQPLVSDENGVLDVIFYLSSGIPSSSPSSAAYKIPNLSVGVVEIVITNVDSGVNNLPESYASNSLSSAKLVFNGLIK